MSFLEDFDELVNQTCTREAYAGADDFAQPSYGTAATHRCRMVHKPVLVRNTVAARSETESSVQELVSNAQVWTAPVGWSPKDRITLSDGSQPQILDVRKFPDENGEWYYEAVFM